MDGQRRDLYFVSGSLDGVVRLWDVRQPTPRSVYKIPDANVAVTALTFNAQDTQVVVGTNVGILFYLFCAGEVGTCEQARRGSERSPLTGSRATGGPG